jgi:regulator of cell morphogenesis and NO signaling
MNEQTVSSYYEIDHDRLDELFKNYQQWKRTDFVKAKEFFKQFKHGLQRHIIWEEDILFPIFEQKTGMYGQGPTEVMRMEHRLIKRHLEAIHDKVKVGSSDTDNDEILLLNTLFQHNEKEERILYPAIDRSMNEGERKGVFETMQNVPKERYNNCC